MSEVPLYGGNVGINQCVAPAPPLPSSVSGSQLSSKVNMVWGSMQTLVQAYTLKGLLEIKDTHCPRALQ